MKAQLQLVQRDGSSLVAVEDDRVVLMTTLKGSGLKAGNRGTVALARCGLLGVRFDKNPKVIRMIYNDLYLLRVCRRLRPGEEDSPPEEKRDLGQRQTSAKDRPPARQGRKSQNARS